MKYKIIVVATAMNAVALGGCAKTAEVNFVNGRAFLAGDDKCTNYKREFVDPDVMECSDASGITNGERRRALNEQQLQFIVAQRQIEAQQIQSLNQSIQQVGASFQPPQYNYTPIPQTAPLTPLGGNQVRCISTGFYTNCRSY